MSTKRNLTWQDFGTYFGYPQCCIKSFYTLEHVGGPTRKLTGTGYIPCLVCNEKSEEELIQVINDNRKARRKFPKEESDRETFKHLGELLGKEVE